MSTTIPRILLTSAHGTLSADEAAKLGGTGGPMAFIGIDQWTAMRDVATMLHDLGHRDAMYLTGGRGWRDAITRHMSWEHYTAKLGIASRTLDVASWDASDTYAATSEALDGYLSAGQPVPTAIVTANDNQAVAVMRALHEHGLRIPQDVSVVGFDDIPGADNLYPPLTTVHPQFDQLGAKATKTLLALLGEGDEPEFERTAHGMGLVPADLVVRDSTGPAPQRD